ncbi:TPA: hypothetical protein JF904_000563 [Legionella pneumophila]|uniref:hypothetical protein n=1 Tax=Legionella pneumophila TaxID=446 RepID=UPI000770868F|nr:hypothetical protein [Legionella pneumophila]HAT9524518.1 hypothetical protein [Legionella pneumophila subsp. pneumophila]CZG23971.1 Uncharacterised protein [Legionella pneumophila]HAT1980368.1 hypothetical protein [Legionella pneumophila]HAT4422690.1 hypothetical protein [Legionella pneumophila]HAU1719432.1 hypothetical protein [Legionella pneumophila]
MVLEWRDKLVQYKIRNWLQDFDTDYCPEDGDYVPVNENEDGSLEPDFKEKRYFRREDPFPDARDWIPCLILHEK